MDASQKWGLPPEFALVRYPIPEEAKIAARAVLGAEEPVLVSLGNEGDTVALVATPGRILTVKTQELGAGAGGAQVKSFPYPGIFDLTLRPQTFNVSFAIEYRTSDRGRTVEIGRRALMGHPKTDTLMAFEKVAGEEAFRALLQLWNWKKMQAQTDG